MKDKSRYIFINPEKDRYDKEKKKLNKIDLAIFMKNSNSAKNNVQLESSHEEESSIS